MPRSLLCDSVGRQGSILQQLLGYHLRLVDVVDICKVTAKRAGQHDLPALTTFHWAGIPFGGCDPAALHPAVGFERELGPYMARGADHRLRLLCVPLKPHLLKQPNDNIQGALKEFCIPQGKVCIIDVKDGKKVTISSSNSASS